MTQRLLHFTGMEDHSISLEYAREMITAFREENPNVEYGWYFGREAIEKILAQTGAVGLRIYGGLKEDGTFRPVLFGVSANGNDIDGIKLNNTLEDSVIILEFPMPCPTFCGGCTDCRLSADNAGVGECFRGTRN